MSDIKYYFVDTVTAASSLFRFLRDGQRKEMLAIDFEVDGNSFLDSKILGCGFSFEDFTGYYVPYQILEKHIADLKVICSGEWLIGGHNAKFEKLVLQRLGIDLTIKWDSLLAAQMMPEYFDAYDLGSLAQKHFPDEKLYKVDRYLTQQQIKDGKFNLMPEEYLAKHCCQDADMSRRLMRMFAREMGL